MVARVTEVRALEATLVHAQTDTLDRNAKKKQVSLMLLILSNWRCVWMEGWMDGFNIS